MSIVWHGDLSMAQRWLGRMVFRLPRAPGRSTDAELWEYPCDDYVCKAVSFLMCLIVNLNKL
jgi:hypothetical protein